ncbi:MAG: hypothetical protein NC223_12250 [Butyrivibrio sp.]|nr:hypothetical protein [Butyrivibrio sp.]
MKKKLVPVIASVMLAASLTACGGKSTQTSSQSKPAQSEAEESKPQADSSAASDTADDLPNWRGVSDTAFVDIGEYTVGDEVKGGEVRINIKYPSLKPSSYGFAYQWDPAFVLVSGCGRVEKEVEASWTESGFATIDRHAILEKLEDAFEVNKEELLRQIKSDRGSMAYDNFEFTVEKQELMTVNGYSVCKYSGTHTYTHEHTELNDNGGLDRIFDDRESVFVTYAVDVNQLDGNISPFMITIIDDSIENPSMEPLPEGIIDTYAIKMIESIEIDKYWWEE